MKTNDLHSMTTQSLLITIGCLWGFTEFFAGTTIKDMFPDNVTGSVLIGLSFFFLAAGYTITKKTTGIIIPLSICILLKLFGTLIIGKPAFHSSIINPVISMVIEAGIFLLMYKLLLNKDKVSLSKKILSGVIGAFLVALLFPLINYFTALPVCIKNGTNIPLSIYYLHFSMLAGAIALPLGMQIYTLIAKFKLRNQEKSLIWGFNMTSALLIILSYWLIIKG